MDISLPDVTAEDLTYTVVALLDGEPSDRGALVAVTSAALSGSVWSVRHRRQSAPVILDLTTLGVVARHWPGRVRTGGSDLREAIVLLVAA